MKLLINYKSLFLILFLPLFYGWFRYLPGLTFVFELTLVGILFSFLFFFRGLKHKIFKNVQSYIFFFLIFIPILGSASAFFTYSQPIFYGLVSYRNLILLLFVLMLIKQLIKGSFTIKHLQSSFLFLAWISLFVFGFIYTFINPNDLDANNFGNLVIDGGGYYNQFNLPKGFILYGIFFYLCMIINNKTRSPFNIISLILFLSFILLTSFSRMLFLSMFISIVFVILNINSVKIVGKLRNFIKFIPILILILVVLLYFNPDYFSIFFSKYSDAFLAITGSNEVQDWSANARIDQSLIVFPLIQDNLLFGTGALSNQWMGGYKEVYGYLHPSDLGLIGILFQIGIFGLLFLLIQYYFAFSAIRKFLKVNEETLYKEFYMSIIAMLLMTCISSITTGSILYQPESIFFLIFIIKFGILSKN
ncbi:MAG: hypothetical protein CML98_08105 [Rhodobiaceae bacterium]|nr:hypothetical protein [Rhodobiaceae bacterium]|tara:strand:- start:13491 stop:14747 length:1257 start_codon:yes stop_codon:yes gene_type:complete